MGTIAEIGEYKIKVKVHTSIILQLVKIDLVNYMLLTSQSTELRDCCLHQ